MTTSYAILDVAPVAAREPLVLAPLALEPAPQTNLPAVVPVGPAPQEIYAKALAATDRLETELARVTKPLTLHPSYRAMMSRRISASVGALIAGVAGALGYPNRWLPSFARDHLIGHLEGVGAATGDSDAIAMAAQARRATGWIAKLDDLGIRGRESRALLRAWARRADDVPEEREEVGRFGELIDALKTYDEKRYVEATADFQAVMNAFRRLSVEARRAIAPLLIDRIYAGEEARNTLTPYDDALRAYDELRRAAAGQLPYHLADADDPLMQTVTTDAPLSQSGPVEHANVVGEVESNLNQVRRLLHHRMVYAWGQKPVSDYDASTLARDARSGDPVLLVAVARRIKPGLEEVNRYHLSRHPQRHVLQGVVEEARRAPADVIDRAARIEAFLQTIGVEHFNLDPEGRAAAIPRAIDALHRSDRRAAAKRVLDRHFHEGIAVFWRMARPTSDKLREELLVRLETP